MAVRTDRAFLLKRSPYGESSLVVHVFTRAHGRVPLIAKGAYRATSRFFCVLDFFDTLELEWSTGRGRDLGLLRLGTVAQRRMGVVRDLARYRAALALLELTELAVRPEQAEPALFDALSGGLDALALGEAPTDLVLVVFELAFLQNLGLAPALGVCAACGRSAEPVTKGGRRAAFSAGAGGRLCRTCAEEARASGRRVGTLPVRVLDAAQELARAGRDALERPLEADLLLLVRDFIERFMDYHLETRPRTSRAFLSVPNRNAPDQDPALPGPSGSGTAP